MPSFQHFINKKSQSYDNIDRFRAFRIFCRYAKIKNARKAPKIIQIIGTNGKGSTGRFLSQMLVNMGFCVGHFTSPHLLKINERFWQNDKLLSDNALNKAHQKMRQTMLPQDFNSLSYFEYCTFLAATAFARCDFIVLEAGLGGEYDATSVFDKDLSVFTPIDKDHTQFLGTQILDIARTKLKVMAKNAVISAFQNKKALKLAQKIALLKNANLIFTDNLSQKTQNALKKFTKKREFPTFLRQNFFTAFTAFCFVLENFCEKTPKNSQKSVNFLDNFSKNSQNCVLQENFSLKSVNFFEEIIKNLPKNSRFLSDLNKNSQDLKAFLKPLNAQEFALLSLKTLPKLDLAGRCQQIAPNIIIDVGHNAHAARAIFRHLKPLLKDKNATKNLQINLKATQNKIKKNSRKIHAKAQKFTLIYNAFADKDIFKILKILSPLLEKVEIYNYESDRKLGVCEIQNACKSLKIACQNFKTLKKSQRYIVFGSFVLVENFLKSYAKKFTKIKIP